MVSAGDPGLIIECQSLSADLSPSLSLPLQAVLSLETPHGAHLPLTPSAVPCVVKSSPLQKQMAPAQVPLVGMSPQHLSSATGLGQTLGML